MSEDKLPVVAILATGGTIAGQAPSPTRSHEYNSGVLAIEALLEAVPGIGELAVIRGEQVCNIGSEDMTDAIWLKLAAAVERYRRDPGVDGMVILHGTDTMEETAYFLHLLHDSGKPVVVTGAMRPANAIGADGPANIFDAVSLAANPEAAGKGVLVCMNGDIEAAREVAKTNTTSLATFRTPGLGALGCMLDGRPHFYRSPIRGGGGFRLDGIVELPRVEILYGHAGQSRELVDAAVAAGAKGIVHAGVGMGMIHRDVRPALVDAVKKGVAVVCSSRVGSGLVPAGEAGVRDGFVVADNLNPQKARVLLQLALTTTNEPHRIQDMFNRF